MCQRQPTVAYDDQSWRPVELIWTRRAVKLVTSGVLSTPVWCGRIGRCQLWGALLHPEQTANAETVRDSAKQRITRQHVMMRRRRSVNEWSGAAVGVESRQRGRRRWHGQTWSVICQWKCWGRNSRTVVCLYLPLDTVKYWWSWITIIRTKSIAVTCAFDVIVLALVVRNAASDSSFAWLCCTL